MIDHIAFAWPWIFLLLPLPLVIRHRQRTESTNAIAVPAKLAIALNSINGAQAGSRWLDYWFPWLCWLLLLIAISQPSFTGNAVAQSASGRAMAVAIDLSGSMEREDFTLDGNTTNRLSVVKAVAGKFIEAQKGNRIALILFAQEAFIASPLSFDTRAVSSYLYSAGIGMAGRSTAIGDALGLAIASLRSDPARDKAIVLLSDGTNNAGTVEPESAAVLAAELNIAIHTIAMASNREAQGYQTSPSADLDEATLQTIAQQSGGSFFRAHSTSELQAIYSQIEKLESAETRAPQILLQHDLRNIVLLALFVFLLGWEALVRTQQHR